MKKLKNSLVMLHVVLVMFLFTGVSNATLYVINDPMSGLQEVPPKITPGTGTLTGTYDDVTNTLEFTVTFSGLVGNTTAAHFHGPAPAGLNAAVRIGLTYFPTGVMSGTYSDTIVLTEAYETELLENNWYLNIHSSRFANGEIRGQIFTNPITTLDLDLTYFIEAFYNDTDDSQVSDTITVQLRNSTSPYAAAYEEKGVLAFDGTIQLQFIDIASGVYYIAVNHRNSIETWGSSQILVTPGSPQNYNFSSASSQAYGNNMIQVDAAPVRFAAYSADVNQDGTIDLTDGGLIDNDAFNFIGGYVVTDVNDDNIVDVADAVFADNNGFNFIGKVTP